MRAINSRGQILMLAIVLMAAMILMMLSAVGYSAVNATAEAQTYAREQALSIAEGGVERAINKLNQDANYGGESAALGNGTYTTAITTLDQVTKRVTSVGQVNYRAGAVAVRTISAVVHIDRDVVSFAYGVQVGTGGLVMDNGSVIQGNVFSNGPIQGSGTVTGTASVAVAAAAASDQSNNIQNADWYFASSSARRDVAQSFVPTESNVLAGVKVLLKKIGSPGNLSVQIVTDNNGAPSQNVLTGGSISAALVTVNYGLISATLNSTPGLTAGTKYWIVLVGTVNANNYYSWGTNNLINTGKYSPAWDAKNPVWNASGGAFDFEIYLGGAPNFLSGIRVDSTARAQNLLGCSIGGDAYFDISNTCTVGGALHAGTPAPAPEPWPISDAQIAEWENTAAAGTHILGNYTIDGSAASLGPAKIDGNLTVTNGAHLNMLGPIWVNGNILVDNNAIVSANTWGASGVTLIADYPANTTLYGTFSVQNNATITGNGQSGSYPLVISTYSGANNAINVKNNAENSIFYAPYGTIDIINNAGIKALTANTIHLHNNASVHYDSGLQHILFSEGPGGSWVFVTGTYAIAQ